MNERELFSRIPRRMMEDWLAKEREETYRYLAEAKDIVTLHRAQGKVLFVERMIQLLQQNNTQ